MPQVPGTAVQFYEYRRQATLLRYGEVMEFGREFTAYLARPAPPQAGGPRRRPPHRDVRRSQGPSSAPEQV